MLDISLLKKDSAVAVALSGGKDSVCLLHMLLKTAKRQNITVKAINVEHGLRGESSIKDSAFVKNLCDELGVPVLLFSVDVLGRVKKTGESLEQAARELRYECFKSALNNGFCDQIATAHHLSDNAETLLLNLIRGSSLKGLCGIKKSILGGKIVRPILSVSRKELDEYARKNGLRYVIDETNFSNDYSRNYLRNEIIPLITKKFPFFENNVARTCESLKADDEALDNAAKKIILNNSVAISPMPEQAIFCRAAIIVFKNLGFTADYTAEHLNALYNLCFLQTGARINLKKQIIAYKEHDKIIFTQNKQKSEAISPLSALSDKTIDFCDYQISIKKTDIFAADFIKRAKEFYLSPELKRDELYFDFEKLPEGAVIRTRENGDEIITFGGVKKSLKKYFTDKKISSRISSTLPLIAKGNTVYAVGAVDVCELLKIDESTKTIAKFICNKKENDDV